MSRSSRFEKSGARSRKTRRYFASNIPFPGAHMKRGSKWIFMMSISSLETSVIQCASSLANMNMSPSRISYVLFPTV